MTNIFLCSIFHIELIASNSTFISKEEKNMSEIEDKKCTNPQQTPKTKQNKQESDNIVNDSFEKTKQNQTENINHKYSKQNLTNQTDIKNKHTSFLANWEKLRAEIRPLHKQPTLTIAMLLAGDRLTCCDEGIVLKDNDQLIGLATIAPHGEQNSGEPTIVALYVCPEYRGRGYGRQILIDAIQRCLERGFIKIRLDVMSSAIKKIINQLPPEIKEKLNIIDHDNLMDFML